MDLSKNRGTPKSSILIGFSITKSSILDHFGVSLFLETPIWGFCWSHLIRDVVAMILGWADSLIVMSCDEQQGEDSALTRWNYLEPK